MMENIKIQKLTSIDLNKFMELLHLFEDVFEMEDVKMPDKKYLQKLLEKQDFMVFVALQDDKILGGLTAYVLQQYFAEQPLAYIYDLAVLTKFQRNGIGRKLIEETNAYCKSLGMMEVFVQADLADDYALEFYRSTGGRAESVVHFTYPLNN
jgi:aminoglycoside 3-N-acetyltransferase I